MLQEYVSQFLVGATGILYTAEDLLDSNYKGLYASLGALQSAHPTASPGNYANVDTGVASDVERYLWDDDDTAWVLSGGTAAVNWGDINGTLSLQSDLQSALDGKSDTSHLHDDQYYTESETDALIALDLPPLIGSLNWMQDTYGATGPVFQAVMFVDRYSFTTDLPHATPIEVLETTPGDGGAPEVQAIFLRAQSGTWTVEGGNALNYYATEQEVEDEINASLGAGAVSVSRANIAAGSWKYIVTWAANGDQSLLTIDGAGLTGYPTRLKTPLAMQPGTFTDANAPADSLYVSADQLHLMYKHGGESHVLCNLEAGSGGGAAVWGNITGDIGSQTDLGELAQLDFVGTDEIYNLAITTEKLDDDAVTADKIGDGAVVIATIHATTAEYFGGGQIAAADAKTSPVDADLIGIVDSADADVLKKFSWANLKSGIIALFTGGAITPRTGALDFSGTTVGHVLTAQAGGEAAFAVAGGIGGSTGANDNRALRSDGTDGSTVQASSIGFHDVYTVSPNSTVNAVVIAAEVATTNGSLCLKPQGTGAFILGPAPDGTAVGGNARGAYAVDLQMLRNAANQVASGYFSGILAGSAYCISSGQGAISGGYSCHATGQSAIAIGDQCIVSGTIATAFNQSNTASGESSMAFGKGSTASSLAAFAHGRLSHASRCEGLSAVAGGMFSALGDAQQIAVQLRKVTTDATPTELRNGTSQSIRLTIPSGKVCSYNVRVTGSKSDGSAVARYLREVIIKNVGGTTTLVNSETIGTDYEDNASCDVAITADDTNDALAITVTGIAAETWRWLAVVEGGELGYGT